MTAPAPDARVTMTSDDLLAHDVLGADAVPQASGIVAGEPEAAESVGAMPVEVDDVEIIPLDEDLDSVGAGTVADPLAGVLGDEDLVLTPTVATDDVEIPGLPDDDVDGNPGDDLPGIGADPNTP